MLERFSLGSYPLLVDYAGRMFFSSLTNWAVTRNSEPLLYNQVTCRA